LSLRKKTQCDSLRYNTNVQASNGLLGLWDSDQLLCLYASTRQKHNMV